MPERGKSRFATVSRTYIRPGRTDGKEAANRLDAVQTGSPELAVVNTG
jgi:hypothetical protein